MHAKNHVSLRLAVLRKNCCFAKLGLSFAACALILLSFRPASAGTLEVQFTGLNLDYDGTSIFDAGTHNTLGIGDPAQSDALTSMNFYLDGTLVGTETTDVFADIYIKDVLNIPAAGGSIVNSAGNGGAFGVDLLTENQTPGWGLALNIDTMQFFYTGNQIAISVAGFATDLFAQNLPFNLEWDPSQPITIAMSSANLTGVTSAGGYLTGFHAAGTGNVAGTGSLGIIVPEPTSIALALFGMLALLVFRRRKRIA